MLSLIIRYSMGCLDNANVKIFNCGAFLGSDINEATEVLDKSNEDIVIAVGTELIIRRSADYHHIVTNFVEKDGWFCRTWNKFEVSKKADQ